MKFTQVISINLFIYCFSVYYVSVAESCGKLEILASDIRTFAPWSVAIYRHVGRSKWEFHTSGTIIGPGLVWSVQVGQQGQFPSDKNPRNFFIAAGINSTDFNSHDQFAQYSRVSLIEPFISEYGSSVHNILYHLDQSLDVKNTPFVRELCYPFFAVKTRYLGDLVDAVRTSVRFEFIQFGFALPSTTTTREKYKKYNKNWNRGKPERKLKLWTVISLPQANCESIYRFYYGKSFVPSCAMRNVESIPGFVSIPKILDKLKVSDSELTEEDELGCHGPGSGGMFTFGNSWFYVAPTFVVPSMKQLRCNSKTVYFGGEPSQKQLTRYARLLYNVFKCPPGKFACKNSQKCLNIQQTCDQKSDCDDSSDEDAILCGWKMRTKIKGQTRGKLDKYSNLTIQARDLNKKCPSLTFPTEGVRCRDYNSLQILDCQTPFFSGTDIRVDCDDHHFPLESTTESQNLYCDFDGKWNQLEPVELNCHKKCGIHKSGSGSGFSWNAAIFISGVHVCSGSLIQDNFILSHAKCVKDWIQFPRKRSDFHVFIPPVSSNYHENLQSNFKHATRIKDVWISVNDLEDKYESGIALIKLETPVLTNKNDSSMAVCSLIPPFSKVVPGKIGTISTVYNQQENFKVASEKECNRILKGRSIINKNEFCAASYRNSTQVKVISENQGHILQGSGWNFMQETTVENSGISLLGIASKIQEGRAVFLEVNSFSDWIVDILEVNS